MTTPRTIDLTPSSIARRLLPDDATDADRAIVEAMAERALTEVPECRSSIGAFFLVERMMVQAARQVIKHHRVRCERVMKFLGELENDPELEELDGIADAEQEGTEAR